MLSLLLGIDTWENGKENGMQMQNKNNTWRRTKTSLSIFILCGQIDIFKCVGMFVCWGPQQEGQKKCFYAKCHNQKNYTNVNQTACLELVIYGVAICGLHDFDEFWHGAQIALFKDSGSRFWPTVNLNALMS